MEKAQKSGQELTRFKTLGYRWPSHKGVLMKKLGLILLTLGFVIPAFAETFEVDVLGKRWYLESNSIEYFGDSVSGQMVLRGIQIRSTNDTTHYLLVAGVGWGSTPLNIICDQLSDGEFPFADSYGVVDSPGFRDGNRFLRVNPDNRGNAKSYDFISRREVQVFYRDLICSSRKRNS